MIIRSITTLPSKPTPQREADFIEAACRKYCLFYGSPVAGAGLRHGSTNHRVGGTRGYEMTGFDLSQPALSYLRRQLARRRLHAETFEAEMSDFRLGRPADAAYCLINTFRHLLTEQAARAHLECIAGSLRPGGIYVLGHASVAIGCRQREDSDCWTQRRGKTKVTVTASGCYAPICRRRIEDVQVCLMARHGSKEFRLQHAFQLRTYTAKAISTAARFGSVAGTVRRLRFPVRH